MKGNRVSAVLLLAPSLLGVLAFYAVPLLWGGAFAVWSPAQGFLGARALADTMGNAMFRQGLGNTLLLLVTAVPLTLAFALYLSFAVFYLRSASGWVQSLLFLPYIVPTVAVIFVFRWAFDFNGVLNRLLGALGVRRVIWLSGAQLRAVILALFVWKNAGFFVVLLSARLSGTPRELVEAAQLDGAGRWRCIRHIYLPQLRLTLVFSTVLCAVQALDIFRECYLLAGSYPAREVYTLQHYLYNCFHRGDYASAASALYALLPVIAGLVWLLLRGDAREKA